MRQKHKDILAKFGAELLDVETRLGRGDALAYIVRRNGKEYRWAVTSVDREIPPWEFSKKEQKRYIYGNAPYVYRMFNSSGDLLYVGKTCQLDYRLYAHFYKHAEEWKDQVSCIDVHRFERESDMHIYEMFLVTSLKPAFNKDASCIDTPSFHLPKLEFTEITDWK